MKKVLAVAAPLALGACGGPVELTVAKLAGDLISYVTTGKSTTDHAVSVVAEKDCALHRPLFDQDICNDDVRATVALADTSPLAIKQDINTSRPAIYAVNAPAENWSNPSESSPMSSSSVVLRADLPPRKAEKGADASDAKNAAPLEVASVTEQFSADVAPDYGVQTGLPDPKGEADAAIAGYIEEKVVAPEIVETRTAALIDEAVMADDLKNMENIDPVKGEATEPLVSPLPGDYVVLASFNDPARANRALEIYRDYQPRLLNATVKGREYIRVAVGPLSSEHARDLRLLAAQKGIKDPWIVGIDPTGE